MIAQSGSAVAPWAFEESQKHEFHTRNIAAMLNCNYTSVEDIVSCMKTVPASNITKAANDYSVSIYLMLYVVPNYLIVL